MPSVKQVPASMSSVSYELGQEDELQGTLCISSDKKQSAAQSANC